MNFDSLSLCLSFLLFSFGDRFPLLVFSCAACQALDIDELFLWQLAPLQSCHHPVTITLCLVDSLSHRDAHQIHHGVTRDTLSLCLRTCVNAFRSGLLIIPILSGPFLVAVTPKTVASQIQDFRNGHMILTCFCVANSGFSTWTLIQKIKRHKVVSNIFLRPDRSYAIPYQLCHLLFSYSYTIVIVSQ